MKDVTEALIGQPVTVIPRRGPGESRDTEAGLQPWEAEFVGFDDEGHPMVKQGDHEPRALHGDLIVNRRGLQIGSY